MRRIVLAVFVVALSVLPAGAGEARKPKWRIQFFVNADNRLELYYLYDLEGVLGARHSDDVVVLAQVDRNQKDAPESSGYSGRGLGESIENWTTSKRFKIDASGVEELEDLGETNCGDPKVLADFLAWGEKNYPADRTALVIADYGYGPIGLGQDEGNGNAWLPTSSLATALEHGRSEPLDLLVFYSAYMSSLEIARACRSQARILVGSEDVAYVGMRDHWKAILSAVADNPEAEPAALAQSVCTEWKSVLEKSKNERTRVLADTATFSAIDLSKTDEVVQSVDALAAALTASMKEQGRAAWLKIAAARNRTASFGVRSDGSKIAYDLDHFAQNLEGAGADDARTRVTNAVRSAVLHNVTGSKRKEASGITLSFPGSKQEFETHVRKYVDYAKIAASPKWMEFLTTYFEYQSKDKEGPDVRDTRSTKKRIKVGEMAQFSTSVQAADVAEMSFFLAMPQRDYQMVIGRYPVKSNEGNDFDGTWLAFGNEKLMLWGCIISYEEVEERTYVVGIPVKYKAPGASEESEVTLFFLVSFNEKWRFTSGRFLHAYQPTAHGAEPIRIRSGGTVRSLYFILTKQGKMERWPSAETLTLDAKLLRINEIPLSPGKYTAGFEITDLAGNVTRDWVDIEVAK